MGKDFELPDYSITKPGSFVLADAPSQAPKDAPGKKDCKKLLAKRVEQLYDLQRVLYADRRYSILCVFQAMDAAGKDSTIRNVFSGVNPAGFQEFSFKRPSSEELDHDFLWRTAKRLPERGHIGIFNRSYYEEVLVVRVHPELLQYQRLPGLKLPPPKGFWAKRYQAIKSHEAHLAHNGTVVLKFWLNVSKGEQKQRFLDRLDTPRKNWKFEPGDVRERGHWDEYMVAYQDAINATASKAAPWFAIPADDKPYMRLAVADIMVKTLQGLDIDYPDVPDADRAEFAELRQQLLDEN